MDGLGKEECEAIQFGEPIWQLAMGVEDSDFFAGAVLERRLPDGMDRS